MLSASSPIAGLLIAAAAEAAGLVVVNNDPALASVDRFARASPSLTGVVRATGDGDGYDAARRRLVA